MNIFSKALEKLKVAWKLVKEDHRENCRDIPVASTRQEILTCNRAIQIDSYIKPILLLQQMMKLYQFKNFVGKSR